MDTLSIVIHVTAAAILVGPQLLMFYAVTPSTWLIDDEQLKRQLVRVVAGRFGQLAGGALVVLLVTGLYQFYSVVPEFVRNDMTSYRFGLIFTLKMASFALLVVLILAHALIFSRRVARLSDAVIAGEQEPWRLEQARTQSLLFSALLLIASFVTLWLGATLGHHEFSYVQR